MCVTCGCGGKKATIEELDPTRSHNHTHADGTTHSHPHGETSHEHGVHTHADGTTHSHPHDHPGHKH